MSRYILGRIVQGIVLLFLVSGVVFTVIHSAPGGPALLNQPDADPAVAREFAEQLGLKRLSAVHAGGSGATRTPTEACLTDADP